MVNGVVSLKIRFTKHRIRYISVFRQNLHGQISAYDCGNTVQFETLNHTHKLKKKKKSGKNF